MTNSKNTKPFYNTTIPFDWDVKTLGDLGKPIIGLTYSPEDVVEEGNGTLVLRSSNVQGSTIVFDNNVYVKCDVPARAKVKYGDILICVRNGSRSLIGKSARIDERCKGMAFGAFMSVFRSEFNDTYIKFFNLEYFRRK